MRRIVRTYSILPSLYPFRNTKSIPYDDKSKKFLLFVGFWVAFYGKSVLAAAKRAKICNVYHADARVVLSEQFVMYRATHLALVLLVLPFPFVHNHAPIFERNALLHSRNAAYAITFDIVPSILLPMYPLIFSGITKPLLSCLTAVLRKFQAHISLRL